MNIPRVDPPGAMDNSHVLVTFLGGERPVGRAVRSDRHDVGRSVRQPHSCSGNRHLHHGSGEVACGMVQPLVRRGDVTGGRVIERTEVNSDDAAATRREKPWQRDRPVRGKDCLRCFDHQLDVESAARQIPLIFEGIERGGQRANLFRAADFWQRDDEIGRNGGAGFEQRRQKEVEGPQAATFELLAERLDADANSGRQRAIGGGCRDFKSGRHGDPVFFFVRSISEAVLEIDSKIFNWIPLKLVHNQRGIRRSAKDGSI